MSHALATTSPTAAARRLFARLRDEPDVRSAAIGVLGVLLVYLLLWLLGPIVLRMSNTPVVLQPHPSVPQFNIEIAPPEPVPVPTPKTPPPAKHFVETNPDAPENIPDRTNNFSSQNQQVAQEKPTPNSNSERPAVEGQKQFESNQIVDGTLHKQPPDRPVPVTPQTSAVPTPATAPRAEQNPLTGFERNQGDNPNAFGSNISNDTANAKAIPKKIEGQKDVPLIEGALGPQPVIDPKHPRSRQSLVKLPQTRPALLKENKIGTQNIGVTAINAKFNEYGLYLKRMSDAVQEEFDRLASEAQTYPPVGSFVEVRFMIDSHGNIARIVNVDNHSSDIGARTSVSSITNRAPYGEWTDDMKQTLNPDGEELIFVFYYQ